MKPIPRYLIIDSANTLTLGAADTEKEAVAQAAKYLDSPRRVTIHDLDPKGYQKRTAVIDGEGLVSK